MYNERITNETTKERGVKRSMKRKITLSKKFKRKLLIIKRITSFIVAVAILITGLCILIDGIKYPEKYITTWKYHLKLDLIERNPEAVELYQVDYLHRRDFLYNNALDIQLYGEWKHYGEDFVKNYDGVEDVKTYINRYEKELNK